MTFIEIVRVPTANKINWSIIKSILIEIKYTKLTNPDEYEYAIVEGFREIGIRNRKENLVNFYIFIFFFVKGKKITYLKSSLKFKHTYIAMEGHLLII